MLAPICSRCRYVLLSIVDYTTHPHTKGQPTFCRQYIRLQGSETQPHRTKRTLRLTKVYSSRTSHQHNVWLVVPSVSLLPNPICASLPCGLLSLPPHDRKPLNSQQSTMPNKFNHKFPQIVAKIPFQRSGTAACHQNGGISRDSFANIYFVNMHHFSTKYSKWDIISIFSPPGHTGRHKEQL